MTDELKPCPVPWCGSKSVQTHEWDRMCWTARCERCGLETVPLPTEKDAIHVWNTRASAGDGMREALKPFAAIADGCEWATDQTVMYRLMAHCRAARAELAKDEG